MGPITLFLAARLGMNPFPFLVSEILASNIGGAATLIGDPPNILIGSAAGLGFGDFLLVMAPLSVILLAVYLVSPPVGCSEACSTPIRSSAPASWSSTSAR